MRQFNLSLCSLRFQFTLSPCHYSDEIDRRLKAYLLPFSPEENGLSLRWRIEDTLPIVSNSDDSGNVILPEMTLHEGALRISHPNFEGRFNLESRSGQARTNSVFPSFNSLLRGFLSMYLPLTRGFLLHAAALASASGDAFLFSGVSGSGKTTLARHALSTGWPITLLSDELVPVLIDTDRPFCHGSPFWGELWRDAGAGLTDNNIRAPLRKIIFIEHSGTDGRTPIDPSESFRRLLGGILLKSDSREIVRHVMDAAAAVAHAVPAERLGWKDREYYLEEVSRILNEAA